VSLEFIVPLFSLELALSIIFNTATDRGALTLWMDFRGNWMKRMEEMDENGWKLIPSGKLT
jgi:hypothetical protein